MASMNGYGEWFAFVFGGILSASFGNCALAQSAEEQAVLAPIHAMFDGMARRDAAAEGTKAWAGTNPPRQGGQVRRIVR